MTTPPPIACSLSGTELPKRLAEMRAIGAAALLTTDRTDTTARLQFHASDGTRARLAAIVAAESHCCAFLTLDLADEDGAILLTIRSPEDEAAVLVMTKLVDAFAGTTTTPAA